MHLNVEAMKHFDAASLLSKILLILFELLPELLELLFIAVPGGGLRNGRLYPPQSKDNQYELS
jgi:hypothetical protein